MSYEISPEMPQLELFEADSQAVESKVADTEIEQLNFHPGLLHEDQVHAFAVQRAEGVANALNGMLDNPNIPIEHLQSVALQAYLCKTQIPERKFQ